LAAGCRLIAACHQSVMGCAHQWLQESRLISGTLEGHLRTRPSRLLPASPRAHLPNFHWIRLPTPTRYTKVLQRSVDSPISRLPAPSNTLSHSQPRNSLTTRPPIPPSSPNPSLPDICVKRAPTLDSTAPPQPRKRPRRRPPASLTGHPNPHPGGKPGARQCDLAARHCARLAAGW